MGALVMRSLEANIYTYERVLSSCGIRARSVKYSYRPCRPRCYGCHAVLKVIDTSLHSGDWERPRQKELARQTPTSLSNPHHDESAVFALGRSYASV